MRNDPDLAFSSVDVSAIVGINPIYLNALVHRKLYGIAPSISDRHGEMKIRIFSEEDVFGIALVWMLFEIGLRPQSIREILLELVDTGEADATVAAEYLSQPGRSHLIIVREFGKSKKKRTSKLSVVATLTQDLMQVVEETAEEHPSATLVLVPVGARFAEIEDKIRAKYGE